MGENASGSPDLAHMRARRVFNLFRLIVAGLMFVAGAELGLGDEAPWLFVWLSAAYVVLALVLGLPMITRAVGFHRLVVAQFTFDILVLAALMSISGGFGSGIAVLMMVYLAAAGLLAEGRMALFFAALASLLVLGENTVRLLAEGEAGESLQVGLVCVGFFTIALTARGLAGWARRSESLAEARGQALDRQQAINERIIEDMNDGVLVIGRDGRLRQANPRAAALLGTELPLGTYMPDLDPLFAAAVPDFDDSPRRVGPTEKLLRCRAVAAGVQGEDRVVYLTDFEEIQHQVQQHKLAALGRLTASMAHEIRNPLSAVSHAAELIQDERRTEVQQRLAQIITDNARRIERMVRDVLALGRRSEAVRETVQVAAMLRDIMDEQSLGDTAQRQRFQMDVPETLRLRMDRAHFYQIFSNLLGNALRHGAGQAGHVHVTAQLLDAERAALHVRDDGPGIAPEQLDAVFEPFFTTDLKGTGLGLYIARELAEANGARLSVQPSQAGAHFVLQARRAS